MCSDIGNWLNYVCCMIAILIFGEEKNTVLQCPQIWYFVLYNCAFAWDFSVRRSVQIKSCLWWNWVEAALLEGIKLFHPKVFSWSVFYWDEKCLTSSLRLTILMTLLDLCHSTSNSGNCWWWVTKKLHVFVCLFAITICIFSSVPHHVGCMTIGIDCHFHSGNRRGCWSGHCHPVDLTMANVIVETE